MTTPTPTPESASPALTLEDLMHAIMDARKDLHATKLRVAEITSQPHLDARITTKQPCTSWKPPLSQYSNSVPDSVPRMRVHAPRFSGDDPTGWIFRIQKYFDYFLTPEPERLQLVAMLIDHPASEWFHYYQANHCTATWEDFLLAVQQRFDPNYYENYVGLLSKLTQTTTVMDYQTAFEAILNKVSEVPESTLVSMFVAGLKRPLQREVNLRSPRSLPAAFALARELSACHAEAATTYSSRPRRAWNPSPAASTSSSAPGILPTPRPVAPIGKTADRVTTPNLPIVRLTNADKAERNKKGLCYGTTNWVADALSRREEDADPAGLFVTYARPIPSLMLDIQRENATAPELQDLHEAVRTGAASPDYIIHDGLLYFKHQTGGLLQPIPIPDRVWESASMDFITGLPPSRGFTVIMVVVDRLTKYAHFGTVCAGYDAPKVAQLFLEVVVKHHGFPVDIISDRDSVFMSLFWRELMRLSGTTLKYSTAYHPQTDGQTEVTNRSLEQYLRAFTHERQRRWSLFLPWAELALNCSHHDTIGMSPFQALYGRPPPSMFPTLAAYARTPAIEELLCDRATMLDELKLQLVKMQHRMRAQANQHRRDVSFNVGDLVLLKLRPYRQHLVARPASYKLAQRYYGPFEIMERVGEVAYRLRLPEGCQIHDVFHTSLLKPFAAAGPTLPQPSLPLEFFNGRPISRPAAALDRRTVLVEGVPQDQWRIRWADGSQDDDTWEPVEEMQRHFPDLRLEDKPALNPGGIDTAKAPLTQDEGTIATRRS
ncbi:unnamed protein product [Cuscuta campestris]|uniref:Integrase catalytic domain-containing protein n=1 Tax=Cuscuta campestris TaxID=132261 RepID=A0A484K160_9ASTE|nr:unnamed protein product [Cuscuta campestris]